MARNWGNTSTEHVDLGDITTARFPSSGDWTFLAFVRFTAFTPDDHAIISKADDRQILFRVTKTDGFIEVFQANQRVIGTNAVTAGTWHLCSISLDGTGANDGTCRVLKMDNTFLEDLTWTDEEANDVSTANVFLGSLRNELDEMDGEICFAGYFDRIFTEQDIKSYRFNPYRVARQYAANCEWFLPMLANESPEPDWGGKSVSNTVTGTNFTIGGNPPIGPLIGLGPGWHGQVAAAAAPALPKGGLPLLGVGA